MLIDSFDKNTYAPIRSFETRITDSGDKSFKSILKKNAENANLNTNSIIQRNSTVCRPLKQFGNISKEPLNQYKEIDQSNEVNKSNKFNKVHIGTLTDETPTVSELLYNKPQYKNRCWRMLENDVNSSKHFRKIPAGTDIYLDKETSEIVWKEEFLQKNDCINKYSNNLRRNKTSIDRNIRDNTSHDITKSIIKGSDFFEKKAQSALYRRSSDSADNTKNTPLNEAVKEFMGKDYSKIDCYELVVNGLKNMGVKYGGKDGLGKHLIDKAVDRGYAQNHYLTGEGLVEATGHSVYNKAVLSVKSPISEAQSAMNEMKNILKEGQILSFSTHSRGHTGVISKNNGVWTFINSGYMDNNIAGKNGKKEVGEEILLKELENWFKLAGKRKESLQITVGNIDPSKLSQYRKDTKNSIFES